jgi:molybdopterin-containing oxidoreductase family iron-sulfur binding subunit
MTDATLPRIPRPTGGDDSTYDADLGRRMGRDARRVVRGDLTERAFFERYHDAVLDEFGFDRRPGVAPDE